MQAVAYRIIERGIANRLGWDPDNLDQAEFEQIRDAVSQALDEIWRFTFWADLTESEQRLWAYEWDHTATYSAKTIVYHIGTDAYYVCLQTTTGDEPAQKVDGEWVVADEFWALAEREYSADDYDASTPYVVGDQVFYPWDGKFYQCIFDATGVDPSNLATWGELVEFKPVIGWTQSGETPIGDVEGLYWQDPEKYPGAPAVEWERTRDGVEPRETPYPTRPWIRFRLRPHRFTGDAYDATLAYEVVDSEDSSTTTSPVPSGSASDTSGVGYAGASALRSRTTHTANQLAYLLYVSTDGDGGEGWFRYSTTSYTADDGVDTLRPNDISSGNPGRWLRIS